MWLSYKEAEQQLGVTKKTLVRRIKAGVCRAKKVEIKTGLKTYIYIEDEKTLPFNSSRIEASTEKLKSNLETLANIDKDQRDYVFDWITIFDDTKGLSKKQIEAYLATYKPKGKNVKLSLSTYYDKLSSCKKYGIEGIVVKRGKKPGESIITDEAYNIFKSLYLVEAGSSAEDCVQTTYGILKNKGVAVSWDTFPSTKSFLRKVRSDIGQAYIDYARKGENYFKRNYEYYIARDWSCIAAGEWWVADHHQLDVICFDNEGHPVRPWVTAWMDLRTNKMLCAYLHVDAPNSDHIFMSFAWCVEKYGLPVGVYLDNGKDYRSLDLNGNPKRYKYWQEESEHYTHSLYNLIDVKMIFAREYNSQAKTIEPRFKGVIKMFSQHMIGYTASDVVKRPEHLNNDIKTCKIMDFKELEEVWKYFTENVFNTQPSKGALLQGLSPDAAWAKFRMKNIRTLTKDSMKILYMRGKSTSITRNGIQDTIDGVKLTYWSDKFYNMKSHRVYVRRDIRAFQMAYVFDAKTKKFICTAQLKGRMPGIISDIHKLEFKDAIKRKNRHKKLAKAAVKVERIDALEIIKGRETVNKERSNHTEFEEPKATTFVATELDVAAKQIKHENEIENIDYSEFAPTGTVDEEQEIDVWGLNKAFN